MTETEEQAPNAANETPPQPGRLIIIDTNVFDCLLPDGELKEKVLAILSKAGALNYGFVICDMVLFELIQEAPVEKEQRLMELLAGVSSLPLTQEVMFASAHLTSLYKEVGLKLEQFNTGDRVIGGASIMNNALILTQNGRDFPEPFFREIAREHVDYTTRGAPACKYFYFKEPQLDVISKHHSIRLAPAAKRAANQQGARKTTKKKTAKKKTAKKRTT